jgi:hypothetical protein
MNPDRRTRTYVGRPTVTKRPDSFDRILQALTALGPVITALTAAAVAGHTIGWW